MLHAIATRQLELLFESNEFDVSRSANLEFRVSGLAASAFSVPAAYLSVAFKVSSAWLCEQIIKRNTSDHTVPIIMPSATGQNWEKYQKKVTSSNHTR